MDLQGIILNNDISEISRKNNQLSINLLSTTAIMTIENWLNQVNKDDDVFIQGTISSIECLDISYSLDVAN